MTADWILVLAAICAAIGFIAGVLIAMPRRRVQLPPSAPVWKYTRSKTVSGPRTGIPTTATGNLPPVTKESQTRRKGR